MGLQAPRFGNGRTITDLAKRVFTEIGVRVESGGAAQADPRASAADVRRSTAAVLQQMSRVARVSSASASVSRAREPPVAVSSNNQSARPPPETTSVVTVKTEEKQDGHWQDVNDIVQMETKEILDTPSFDTDDGFFSAADRQTLRAALSIADIAEDSPDINGGNSDLRRVLLLPQEAGGIGLSEEEADTFMRGVDADREALKRALVEATEVEKEEEARMDAMKNETSDAAEAITTAVESGVDQETLKLLEALQRAKEEALKKAREEMERRQALERAAQAALKRMGKCVAGFRWIRQSGGGWRCAGGTHYVSSGEVAAEMAREPSR